MLHNLPTHLCYVSTLPDITQTPNIYVVINSVSGSENNRLCG